MGHVPVLLDEVMAALPPMEENSVIVDMTFGGGGYTQAFLEKTPASVVALDRDADAIERGKPLQEAFTDRLHLVHTPFSQLRGALQSANVVANPMAVASQQKGMHAGNLAAIVFDLGVSSFQLDVPERGFSFRADGPLDMRMGCTDLSAADVVATYTKEQLADIFWRYGEEKYARQMAEAIVNTRELTPILRTSQLVDVLHKVRTRRHKDKVDPATKVFQALRIEVNKELEELEIALQEAIELLPPAGVLIVVTFHSLEDRIVKQKFRSVAGPVAHKNKYKMAEDDAAYTLLTRKPVLPTEAEIQKNARARSAKMRVLRKNKHKMGEE